MKMPSCISGTEIPLLLACSIYLHHYCVLVSSVANPFPNRKRDNFTLTATLTQHMKKVQNTNSHPVCDFVNYVLYVKHVRLLPQETRSFVNIKARKLRLLICRSDF